MHTTVFNIFFVRPLRCVCVCAKILSLRFLYCIFVLMSQFNRCNLILAHAYLASNANSCWYIFRLTLYIVSNSPRPHTHTLVLLSLFLFNVCHRSITFHDGLCRVKCNVHTCSYFLLGCLVDNVKCYVEINL